MAAPLNAPLPPFFGMADGMTIRVTALDSVTGATVGGVTVSGVSIDVDPGPEASSLDNGISPTPLLVPGEIGG